jgi:hypothetical protein
MVYEELNGRDRKSSLRKTSRQSGRSVDQYLMEDLVEHRRFIHTAVDATVQGNSTEC